MTALSRFRAFAGPGGAAAGTDRGSPAGLAQFYLTNSGRANKRRYAGREKGPGAYRLPTAEVFGWQTRPPAYTIEVSGSSYPPPRNRAADAARCMANGPTSMKRMLVTAAALWMGVALAALS